MTARFILSLDCEGKWGAADALKPQHHRYLTSPALGHAYRAVLDLLDEFEIEATFAFAGIFAQTREQFDALRSDLDAFSRMAPDFLGAALRDIDAGGTGWHGGDLIEAVVTARTSHEIALHGVTHVPWASIDVAGAEAEMRLFTRLEGPVRGSRTFVYPRNLIAHIPTIIEYGFEGFRMARPHRSRLRSFLSEFNIFETPDQAPDCADIVRIPTGTFLNWRHGLRLLVPPILTHLRAKRLLALAEATGGVVHYWLHPENVATAPATLHGLRRLVEEVAKLRDAGKCHVLTQLGYCQWRKSLP